jgi:hypothetical protein
MQTTHQTETAPVQVRGNGMTRRTKTWKIGEYCNGGTVRVKSCGEFLKIDIVDYFDGFVLDSGAFGRIHERQISEFLNRQTTCYYSDKILTWIKLNVWGIK